MRTTALRQRLFASLLALVIASCGVAAQSLPGAAPAASSAQAPLNDAFGRSTPRGTVLGFLAAARRGDNELARHYLNTSLREGAAEALAHQLFVVLDTRLPARLTQVSDAPEGSRDNPMTPGEERIGTVEAASGSVPIVVERVAVAKAEPVWLFSARTLAAVPALYEEIEEAREPSWMPRLLIEHGIDGVPLYEWLAVLIGLPLFYALTVLLNRLLAPLVALVWRRQAPALRRESAPDALPAPVRLLLLSAACRWLLAALPLSLLVRQALSNAAAVLTIVSVAWLVVLLAGEVERYVKRRIRPANFSAAVALLHVGRRIVDVLIVFAAILTTLRHFGVDPTPLLAGLGVGGIAVALAAQKTLENVIAGASLIFDQAVRIGDFLRVGAIEGVVDHIGLRSTRIRTLERTIVSVPNSQIANMTLESLSARDKFWFHPVVGLRYETTPDQMRLVVDGIRELLARHNAVDASSVRVRFVRLGAFALDVEIFAYVQARDWAQFLEVQEGLLSRITEIVSASGTEIAFPSQTMYVNAVNPTTPQFPTPK